MPRALLVFALAASLATGAHSAPDPVDVAITRVMNRLHVPGMAIAVVRDGHVEKLASYGLASVEWQAPVTTSTRFQLASATKVLTGTLVMELVQDGVLALDAPVSRYVPDAPDAWRAVTIAHLAAHASGIPDRVDPAALTTEAATASLAHLPLAFAPGTQAVYGNGDFVVLARVLERVGGRSFPELLRARLLDRLGMTCTGFDHAAEAGPTRTADVLPARAGIYRWDRDHLRTAWFFYPEPTYAAGGAFSCLSDLVTWAVAMDEGRLLTPASEQRAATAFHLLDGHDAGFGVAVTVGTVRGRRVWGHSGGPALADILRVPDEKLTVIVLANQQRLHPNLAPVLAQLFFAPGKEPPALRDAPPALTRTVRGVLDQLASGTLADTAFAPSVRAELVPALRDWGPAMTAVLPALDRLELVEDRRADGRHERRYRATYGPFVIGWRIALDAKDRILELEQTVD